MYNYYKKCQCAILYVPWCSYSYTFMQGCIVRLFKMRGGTGGSGGIPVITVGLLEYL